MKIKAKNGTPHLAIKLIFAFLISLIGMVFFSILSIYAKIQYAGISFGFLGEISAGDESPLTFSLMILSFILVLLFPLFVSIYLTRKGIINKKRPTVMVLTFIIIGGLPLWIYIGLITINSINKQTDRLKDMRRDCIVKNGENVITYNSGATTKVECKNGIKDGLYKRYDPDGKLFFVNTYRKGKDIGPIINYNKFGGTLSYDKILKKGEGMGGAIGYTRISRYGEKIRSVYVQNFHESDIQKQGANNEGKVVNGEVISPKSAGNSYTKKHFKNELLDGDYDIYKNGINIVHLELKEGKLNGLVYEKDEKTGEITYSGQYADNLQEGTFKRYTGRSPNILLSEIIFEKGNVVKVVFLKE